MGTGLLDCNSSVPWTLGLWSRLADAVGLRPAAAKMKWLVVLLGGRAMGRDWGCSICYTQRSYAQYMLVRFRWFRKQVIAALYSSYDMNIYDSLITVYSWVDLPIDWCVQRYRCRSDPGIHVRGEGVGENSWLPILMVIVLPIATSVPPAVLLIYLI